MKKFAGFIVFFFLMIALLCLPTLLHAQITDPNCDPLDPGCPIDGGLSLLLAAGIGYGIKKSEVIKKRN